MARAYSDDLRKKLLEAHDTGKATLAEWAERFGVSRGWAWKISSVRAPTGATARPPYRPGRKARVDRQVIEQLLEAQPELLLRELGAKFTDRTGVSVSLPHVWRLVRGMGSRLKKCRSTPLSATPRPTGSGAKRMSKEIFLAYLDQGLCPKLQPGQVVAMDNPSSHKVAGVRERIEAAGGARTVSAAVLAGPQPDRKAWAKLKQQLRACKARSVSALDQSIAALLPTITQQDATAWFRLPFEALQQ